MAEEFQWRNCGGRNWWDSLRNLFCSPEVNDLVSLWWPLNPANSVGDDSAGSDSDVPVSSILPMWRIRLSSSPTTEDWNRDLLHDSGRSEKSYSHMPSTNFFADSSVNSFKKVNDQSLNPLDQHRQPSNSFTNLPPNSASYNHTSSLLQTLFDIDYLLPQQSLLGNLQPPNYPMNSAEILPSLPKANHLQFTNNTHLWNATVEASGDVPGKSRNSNTAVVEEEELRDPITALHHMVSPFGKTDAASVLYETIGYIKFLNNQISVLSSPYSIDGGTSIQHQQVTDEIIKDEERVIQDLKSLGLCLVPISTTFFL